MDDGNFSVSGQARPPPATIYQPIRHDAGPPNERNLTHAGGAAGPGRGEKKQGSCPQGHRDRGDVRIGQIFLLSATRFVLALLIQ